MIQVKPTAYVFYKCAISISINHNFFSILGSLHSRAYAAEDFAATFHGYKKLTNRDN